jgi:hypothetical protein
MKTKIKNANIKEAEMIADGWIKSTEQPPIILFEKPRHTNVLNAFI